MLYDGSYKYIIATCLGLFLMYTRIRWDKIPLLGFTKRHNGDANKLIWQICWMPNKKCAKAISSELNLRGILTSIQSFWWVLDVSIILKNTMPWCNPWCNFVSVTINNLIYINILCKFTCFELVLHSTTAYHVLELLIILSIFLLFLHAFQRNRLCYCHTGLEPVEFIVVMIQACVKL